MRLSQRFVKWCLVLPAVVFLFSFTIYPFVYLVVVSFTGSDLLSQQRSFTASLDNYKRLVSDPFFTSTLLNTAKFTLASVSVEIIFGVVLASIFTGVRRFGDLLYSVTLVPSILPPLAVAVAWKLIFDTNFGVLNFVLSKVGAGPIPWLDHPKYAMFSLILVDIWQWTPFCIVIILLGLQSIPKVVYEMAAVDGASRLQSFCFITLPLVRHFILIVLLLRMIDALRLFDQVYALTAGGPGNATETLSFYIYKIALKFFDIGYAATMSLVMLIFVLMASLTCVRLLRREE